jgi:hypothetical protein
MFRRFLILVMLLSCAPLTTALADEGMWPMSEIRRLDLKSKGLQIPVDAIYNPDSISLVDGICSLGGCTGSFVSSEGLIITNHHCAFNAVQDASTPERNYLELGFNAAAREQEVQARGMTVRITESYRDVSSEVLAVVQAGMEPAARAKAIERRTKEIVAETESKNPGKRAEVAEMFIGKSYVLFIYTYLKDVRLVFAPPRGIGNFGGETDNWIWPRHTGDFSFFRAYVGPDGRPADYSMSNVPYHPKKFIQVAPEGVSEGDFIFICGYPGRTYRHQAASYLDYEYRVRMPMLVDWYGWQIRQMEEAGKNDPAAALKLAPRIKSLSNTYKNNRGKLAGISRTHMVQKWRDQESKLAAFIDGDAARRSRYGQVLPTLAAVYNETGKNAAREFVLQYLTRSPETLRVASSIYEAAQERRKPDLERESAYMERNWRQTVDRVLLSLKNVHAPVDRAVLRQLLVRASGLPADQRIKGVDATIGTSAESIGQFLARSYGDGRILQENFVREMLTKSPEDLAAVDEPFLHLAAALYAELQSLKDTEKRRSGELNRLYGLYIEAKREFLGAEFVPDANSTLRFTFGHIRSYQPADGLLAKPITTLTGVVEKNTGEDPFNAPPALLELYRKQDFGPFAHPVLKDVPVAILYDADTTGGNSGSPILNARGQLIGVNFDRAWEATINDYGWSPDYSRSIGVDIRYVLWVTLKIGRAEHLLREMRVKF